MEKREIKLQELGRRLVEREINLCVSGLVHTLAQGYGQAEARSALFDLCEQALELCTPTQDYEGAAYDEGWRYREVDGVGEIHKPGDDEAETYDDWQACCEGERIEPHECEIYEHWAVTPWLRARLQERGERVGDLDSLDVWGRGATGQAIALDFVIQQIAAEIWADELKEVA